MDCVLALALIEKGSSSAAKLESVTLDFKTEKPTAKETFQDLAEAAVCFANADGGSIVLGVADAATGPGAFVGTTIDDHLLRSKIHALTEPHLQVNVSVLNWAGSRLLHIQVPEGLDVHSTGKGIFTKRWNDTCLPMRPSDVARLEEERRGIDWSAGSSGRPVSDLDAGAMLTTRRLLRTLGDDNRRRLASLNDLELLTELNLTCGDGTLTRAAALALCQPSPGVHHDLAVYQYRRTRSGETEHTRRWQQPLLVTYIEAMDTISARVGSVPVNTSRGQQLSLEDFPIAAVREALANALIHGDHREKRPVQIEHSPEGLTVRSPGPLVSGITPANILTHGSRARFPLLAALMRKLGLAEELGQGVDRMFREMVKSGREIPRVYTTTEDAETGVDFVGGPPNVKLAKFIADLPAAEQTDTDTLLITFALCHRRSLTARDIAPMIQRDPQEAETVLRRLTNGEAEILEPTSGTVNRKFPNYRFRGSALSLLGDAVKYNRRSPSETDAKAVAHVREYSTINNSTLQRIFDIDVYQARDLLQDLVGREILVRVSTQTRGVAVRYGPGPKFPERPSRRKSVRRTPEVPASAVGEYPDTITKPSTTANKSDTLF